MIFKYFSQGELLTQETLEFLAQQQLSTQLIVILMVVLVVGGSIAFFSLRGFLTLLTKFINTVSELKDGIEKLNTTEEKRYLVQETFAQYIEQQFEIQSASLQRTDGTLEELMHTIRKEFKALDSKLDKVIEAVENHPEEHEALLLAIQKLSSSIDRANKKTDELPELS